MIAELREMLALQEAMNSRVNSGWREAGYAWYRAIWTECAEMLDHYGWKWWKQQTPDREQVALELIDIWHFGLSILLLDEQGAEEIAEALAAGLAEAPDDEFREALESFTLDVLQRRSFDPRRFGKLMRTLGLSFDELHRSYVGKNVLNFFRQDHGYQEGRYLKVWGEREDNEHLVEILAIVEGGEDLQQRIYAALRERYPE